MSGNRLLAVQAGVLVVKGPSARQDWLNRIDMAIRKSLLGQSLLVIISIRWCDKICLTIRS